MICFDFNLRGIKRSKATGTVRGLFGDYRNNNENNNANPNPNPKPNPKQEKEQDLKEAAAAVAAANKARKEEKDARDLAAAAAAATERGGEGRSRDAQQPPRKRNRWVAHVVQYTAVGVSCDSILSHT